MDGDDVLKDEASNALSCRLICIIMAAVNMSGEVEKLMFVSMLVALVVFVL